MTNITEELDLTGGIPLPNASSFKDTASKNKTALKDVRSANNKLNGKGKSYEQGNYQDNKDNIPVNLENVLAKPKVELLTMDYLNLILGKKKVDKEVREKVLEFINKGIEGTDPALGEYFRNTCIDVMDTIFGSGSKISLQQYMAACLYVTYRSAGDTKIRAYSKVFPDRVMRMQQEGQSMSHLHSYAEIYAKSKAVIDVQAKVMMPTHLLCHDLYFEAMRVTAEIMNDDSVSPKVRVEAANNIMNHTKQPEIKQQELNINIKESNEIDQLKQALNQLAVQQEKQIIEGNYTVLDVIGEQIYIERDTDND